MYFLRKIFRVVSHVADIFNVFILFNIQQSKAGMHQKTVKVENFTSMTY